MALTMRTVLTAAIPTLAALFGIFWFRRKKKPPAIEPAPEPAPLESATEVKPEINHDVQSVPTVYVTQPSQPTPTEQKPFEITKALDEPVEEVGDSGML